ncbi:LPS assembly lipoprotein LptE [Otariodibacter sp.]|uniref:LPS-assembly lipoprotein LptE n=1 Tax=Otariodibacter sp. TaxID=3030919 RepID=UPI002633C7BA|nr:LPS assembly lipoprotein LptE [Otariodibacter sp.]
MFNKCTFLLVFLLTACGWHFKTSERFPEELRTLHYESSDMYSDMSRVLRNELLLNGITVLPSEDNSSAATLRLNATENSSVVASVFKQAREAEKILSLTVKATMTIPEKGSYPLEVTVHRTFFDDSRAALAKSEERTAIINQMYEQASRQLLVKMIGLQKELAKHK